MNDELFRRTRIPRRGTEPHDARRSSCRRFGRARGRAAGARGVAAAGHRLGRERAAVGRDDVHLRAGHGRDQASDPDARPLLRSDGVRGVRPAHGGASSAPPISTASSSSSQQPGRTAGTCESNKSLDARRRRRHAGRRADGQVRAHQVQRRPGSRLRRWAARRGAMLAQSAARASTPTSSGRARRARACRPGAGRTASRQQPVEQQRAARAATSRKRRSSGETSFARCIRATRDTARACSCFKATPTRPSATRTSAEAIKEWTNVLGLP